MFPMEFDRKNLSSLPLPSERGIRRVLEILNAIVSQKIVPYFRSRRGTDLMHLASVKQNLSIRRLEDEDDRIRMVSLLSRSEHKWTVLFHERFFDYLAFVIPLKPELSLSSGSNEERKLLTFSEFILRHNVEHMLYPERQEQDVIRSDIDFALSWKKDDPTSYKQLRTVLEDEMNGLKGQEYLQLFDKADDGKAIECAVSRLVHNYGTVLSGLPKDRLEEVFTQLQVSLQTKILGDRFRKSRNTLNPLTRRAENLQQAIRLFSLLLKANRQQALSVFRSFNERWGVMNFFHELELPKEEHETDELFKILESRLQDTPDDEPAPSADNEAQPTVIIPAAKTYSYDQPGRSIKERIEEARNDPFFPRAVMELIDKNKMNAAGQSGAKYTELIETLLTIPWGRIIKISVTPSEFEEGLNKSHHGLRKPKEIASDFFANLIWRYQHFRDAERRSWKKTGSALLFVGPPGVGKTSLAISIARNLGIPYHKVSLGGMKDEADIRGYGFTYEGSKPGPIVQGLIKMGAMNGMFILDEVDKTEKFAVSTLLEILDPEQNHLFHDKYIQSTVDIDLSNAHFILTANSLETVPAPILDRCEVIVLNRYSVDEKIAIARDYLMKRVREKYMLGEREIFFDRLQESELLRYLIKNFTFEAGVRDLERIIRTLFLRIHRKEILAKGKKSVRITREKLKEFLDEPIRPRLINEEDRIGEMMGLGVNMEMGTGSLIPIQATQLKLAREQSDRSRSFTSIVHATGNIEKVMDESRKVASTAISHCADELGINLDHFEDPIHLHFMGASTKKDGPSAGGAIALALASRFLNRKLRRDVSMTGEIDTQGRITGIGGLGVKLETAYSAGCKTMIIPRENLHGEGGISQLPEGFRQELQILTYEEWKSRHEPFDYTRQVMQVVAVDHILQAADVAFIDEEEIDALESSFTEHARIAAKELSDAVANSFRRLRVIYIEDPDELDTEFYESDFCRKDHGCTLLVNPEVKERVLSKVEGLTGLISVREFDPHQETFTEILQDLVEQHIDSSLPPLRTSVIAPLTFLQSEGVRMEDFPMGTTFLGLRLFAGTCTVENVQICDSRKIINRAYLRLAHFTAQMIEKSPFMVRKDGIYMVSLSFIPEKYRLDSKRGEEILNRCLSEWLNVIDEKQRYTDGDKLPELSIVRK